MRLFIVYSVFTFFFFYYLFRVCHIVSLHAPFCDIWECGLGAHRHTIIMKLDHTGDALAKLLLGQESFIMGRPNHPSDLNIGVNICRSWVKSEGYQLF